MLIYERGRGKGYRGATTAAAAASHVIDSNHIKLIASAQLISKEPHTHTQQWQGARAWQVDGQGIPLGFGSGSACTAVRQHCDTVGHVAANDCANNCFVVAVFLLCLFCLPCLPCDVSC